MNNVEELPLVEQLQVSLKQGAHTKDYNFSILELPHAIVLQGKVRSYFHKQMAQEEAGKFLKDKIQHGFRFMLRNEIVVE